MLEARDAGGSQSPQPHLKDGSVYRQNRPAYEGSSIINCCHLQSSLRSTAHEYRYPSRVKSYEAIEWLTSEKSGVGAKWKQTRTVYGKSHTQTIEVVEWREPTSFALTAAEAGATYLTRYSLGGLDVFRGPAQQPVQ